MGSKHEVEGKLIENVLVISAMEICRNMGMISEVNEAPQRLPSYPLIISTQTIVLESAACMASRI